MFLFYIIAALKCIQYFLKGYLTTVLKISIFPELVQLHAELKFQLLSLAVSLQFRIKHRKLENTVTMPYHIQRCILCSINSYQVNYLHI